MLLQYLLSVEEFSHTAAGGRLLAEAADRVDCCRREKAAAMRPGRGQEASLGAGLLLQLALREALKDKGGDTSPGAWGKREEPEAFAEFSVSSLLAELESMPPIPAAYRYSEGGKPYFRDFPFYFSLSHSGDYVLLVMAREEVGADIQQHRECGIRHLADRFYSPEEKNALEQAWRQGGKCREEQLFFRLWARKEAYGKLTGRGVMSTAGINLLPPEHDLPGGSKLPPEHDLPGGSKLLPEHSLSGGSKLLWTENRKIPGYSAAVCRYSPLEF